MKGVLILTVALSLILLSIPIIFEVEIADSATATDVAVVSVTVTDAITLSAPADVNMGTITGITGGTASGSATWTVTTNSAGGFTLALKSSTNPALATGSYSFANYTEASSGTPDYAWSVAASAAEFGFTVEASATSDLVQLFRDSGSACNTGGLDTTDRCWYRFATADLTVINRGSKTTSSGVNEVAKFQAQVGSTSMQEGGTYQATITATATTQ